MMCDVTQTLQTLNRPNLLVRAARIALSGFQRETALTRIFGIVPNKHARALVHDLIEREAQLNAQRKAGDVTYNIARHITVLTALMSESHAYLGSEQRPT